MGTDPAWGGKGLAAGKSGCFQELGGGFRQFVNTDRKERGEQAAEHEAAGPAVLKLPRERQGIPAPCIKAPEERAALLLLLCTWNAKGSGPTSANQTETVRKFLPGHLGWSWKAPGSFPPSSFTAGHSPGPRCLSPCTPLPSAPREARSGPPLHPWSCWALRQRVCLPTPRGITTSCAQAPDKLLLAAFPTQGLLVGRNPSSRDHLASVNCVSQRPSQVDVGISFLLTETAEPKLHR